MNPTLPTSNELKLLLPEISLVVAMVCILTLPLSGRLRAGWTTMLAAAGLLASSIYAAQWVGQGGDARVLSGMLTIDPLSQFYKSLAGAFTLAVVALGWLTGAADRVKSRDLPELLCLLLGATLGMMLMASASNLLMIVVAIEMASLPSYVLAGVGASGRRGSEGAVKFALFGAACSCITIFGMSLLYGVTGSLDLGTVAWRLAELSSVATSQGAATAAGAAWSMPALAWMGLLATLAGVGFKLSTVPTHFWCPDVFEAAPVEVSTFLSVASKGAGVCLLLRLLSELGAAGASLPSGATLGNGVPFEGLALVVALVGAITATWANLAALGQVNIKRMLAYSSIAQGGYMTMAASLMVVSGKLSGSSGAAIASSVMFYFFVYVFMNLGAFAVAAVVSQRFGSDDVRDYAGLAVRSPGLAVVLTIFMLSLFGMPGLGGFWAKIGIMKVMSSAGGWGFVLVAVVLINTVLSLYYYLRPVYYAVLVPEHGDRPGLGWRGVWAVLALCAAAVIWTGLLPNQAMNAAAWGGNIITAGQATQKQSVPAGGATLVRPTGAVRTPSK